jgi:hypothetical protein
MEAAAEATVWLMLLSCSVHAGPSRNWGDGAAPEAEPHEQRDDRHIERPADLQAGVDVGRRQQHAQQRAGQHRAQTQFAFNSHRGALEQRRTGSVNAAPGGAGDSGRRVPHQPPGQRARRLAVAVGDLAADDRGGVAQRALQQAPPAAGQVPAMAGRSSARAAKSMTLMSAFMPGASTPRSVRPAARAVSEVWRRTSSGKGTVPSRRSRPQ